MSFLDDSVVSKDNIVTLHSTLFMVVSHARLNIVFRRLNCALNMRKMLEEIKLPVIGIIGFHKKSGLKYHE